MVAKRSVAAKRSSALPNETSVAGNGATADRIFARASSSLITPEYSIRKPRTATRVMSILRFARSLLRQTINLDQTYAGAAILASHNRGIVTRWKGNKNCRVDRSEAESRYSGWLPAVNPSNCRSTLLMFRCRHTIPGAGPPVGSGRRIGPATGRERAGQD